MFFYLKISPATYEALSIDRLKYGENLYSVNGVCLFTYIAICYASAH